MAKKKPTYEELKALLEKRTAELVAANEGLQQEMTARKLAETELQKHNQLMSEREDRVLELKKTINDLLAELGRKPKYQTTADTDEKCRTGLQTPSGVITGLQTPSGVKIVTTVNDTDRENVDVMKPALPQPTSVAVDWEATEKAGIEKPELDICFIPIICSAPLLYAHSHGFFARNGLDVHIKPAPSWSGIKELITHSKVDAAHMLAPMPLACNLGIDGPHAEIRLATVQNINGQALTLAKKHLGIKEVREMKGFTFGVPYRFSMQYYLLSHLLAQCGLNPLTDVTIKEVAPPRMPYYLSKGWLDGIFAPEPFNQIPVYQGIGFIYILSKDIWHDHPCCSFATSQDFIDRYPNTYRILLRSVLQAELALHRANPEERKIIAREIVGPGYLNQEQSVPVEQALSGDFPDGKGQHHMIPNRMDFIPHPQPEYGSWILSQMQRWGQLPGKVNYHEIVDHVFQNETCEIAEALGFGKVEKPNIKGIYLFTNETPFSYMRNQPFSAYQEQAKPLQQHELSQSARIRLTDIISHLSDLAGGKSSAPLEITSAGEIGYLEQIINETIQNLRLTQEALLEQKDVLETRVMVRTEELRKSEKIAWNMMEDAKDAKEQADAANRAKSEFLSSMSHEIRTPLNAVIGFSELLYSLITDKKQKSYLDSIQTAGKSMLTLINDILNLAKIEAGRLDIQYEAINPAIIFKELEQIFALKIAEKGLDFMVEIDKELPPALLLDETRLRQVLLNLIGNAIKFTEKGYIKLSVQNKSISKVDDLSKVDLIIAVADTGIGIPENQQEMIFESFRQQDGQSTRKYGGTGLGLAISKRLVEMMNGHISVSSPNETDQGSVFEIILRDVPVSATVAAEKAENAFDFNKISFEQARVLVVDDIESNRNLIKECLSKVNLDVVEAEDGQKAVLFTQEYLPDLILMDIRMPVMDGYEATKQLKKNPSTQHIPIIALTASVDLGKKSKLMTYCFEGYLPKPVNMHALFGELSHYLKHSVTTEPVTENEVPVDSLKNQMQKNIARFPDLIEELKNQVMPLWEDIGNGMVEIHVIENFADTLVKRASKYNLPGLINYADKLREYAQDFDIDNIEVALKELIEILENATPTPENIFAGE